jgi:hypothetical protein
MKKEIVACDVCGHELREGFVMKGCIKRIGCCNGDDIGGEDTEMHFHEMCFVEKLFPDCNLTKKRIRNGKAQVEVCEGADKVFDEVDDV